MALFILFWDVLHFLTFRVNLGVRFAFVAMRKWWSCRFLENDMYSP